MYYHHGRRKNPSPVLAPLLLSIVHLHSENGKVTRTAITLVGLGRDRFAFYSFADCCFASRRHHLDSVPVSNPDLHLHRVCDRYSARIQHLPASHGALAELLLYDYPAAVAMDTGHRPACVVGGAIGQRWRTFVFRDRGFFCATTSGRSALLRSVDVHCLLDHQLLGRLHARAQPKLPRGYPAGCDWPAHYSEL